jgi:arsenate reductase
MSKQQDHSTEEGSPHTILFLCTHNSSRSQMAEGLLNARGDGLYRAYSAGTQPTQVHPLAIKVMVELGIDISEAAGHRAKSMTEFKGQQIDLVVTVCDDAAEACPFFPGARRQIHWSNPDPSAATGTEEERLVIFRQVRDALAARINELVTERNDAH